jgi:hypothetical protein
VAQDGPGRVEADPRIRIAGAEHTVPKETTVKAAK